MIYRKRRCRWIESDTYLNNAHMLGNYRPFVEEIVDYTQSIIEYVPDLIYSARCYIRNRFISKSHVIDINLNPGLWYDMDFRIELSLCRAAWITIVDEFGLDEFVSTGTENRTHREWNQLSENDKISYGRQYMESRVNIPELTDDHIEAYEFFIKFSYWWQDVRNDDACDWVDSPDIDMVLTNIVRYRNVLWT